MTDTASPAFRAISDAVLAITAEPVLQRLVDSGRELAGARYAAFGVPDGADRGNAVSVSAMAGV